MIHRTGNRLAFFLAMGLSMLVTACSPDNDTTVARKPDLTVLATGAGLAGANGIQFSPDNLLYIASVIGSSITVIDPDTGELIRRYDATDGVYGPDDLDFSPEGSFYWTSILTGEVAGMTPGGDRIVAASLTPGVNPVTFSDDGRLFVSQCFFGTGLYELDPYGLQPARQISGDLGPGCGLNGMDWGPDDRLYGPRWFTGEVVSFNVDDNSMRLEASGFRTPAAVKFDRKGILHVLDTGTGEVIRLEGDTRTVIATLSPGLDNFAFDRDNRLFVSSFTDGFVKRVEADGSLTTLMPSGMAHPGGITLLADHIVVADLHALRFYDPETGEETSVQRNILGTGEMGGAINLSTDGENLILVSWLDNNVRIWNPASETMIERYDDLHAPVAAVRYGDGLIVSEYGSRQVVSLHGGDRDDLFEFDSPAQLVVDRGNLYVADRIKGTIHLIGHDNELMESPVLVAHGLQSPEGFAVTRKGFVVLEAATGNIVEVDAEGSRRHLASIEPGSPAATAEQPDSMIFNGLVMDPDGTVYLTGETTRKLYRLAR